MPAALAGTHTIYSLRGLVQERLGFIGAGKVGTALASLLHERGLDVVSVSGRTLSGGRKMALTAGLPREAAQSREVTVARSDIVFLTVTDDAIAALCDEIAASGGWRPGQGVVHCSGALPSSILNSARKAGAWVASFHPLQAFADPEAAREHMPGSTFALEGDPELVTSLDKLVEALGGVALHLSPDEKTLYHAAAVIASNYVVTLAALASGLLVDEKIAPGRDAALRYLLPLIKGTVDNLGTLGLPGALTGPVARGDAGTVERHLEALEGCAPRLAAIYRQLARLTLPLAEEKGGLGAGEADALRAALDERE